MPKMFCFFFLIRNILNPSVHLDPKAVGTRLVELQGFFFFFLSFTTALLIAQCCGGNQIIKIHLPDTEACCHHNKAVV